MSTTSKVQRGRRAQQTTIIQPTTSLFRLDLTELWGYRDLFWILTLRTLKLRYKQTLVGLSWVVLQPLLAAALLSLVFGRLGGLPSDGAPYFLNVYAGLLAWNIFDQTLRRGSESFVVDRTLISRAYFPRIIVPLSRALSVLVDFCVALAFMLVLMALYRHSFSWSWLALPVLTLHALVLSAGILLALSAINVYYRDVTHALPFVLRLLLFASPVAYAMTLIPQKWHTVYQLNPLAGLIEAFRWALLGGRPFPASAYALSAGVSVVCALIGCALFYRLERGFADSI